MATKQYSRLFVGREMKSFEMVYVRQTAHLHTGSSVISGVGKGETWKRERGKIGYVTF